MINRDNFYLDTFANFSQCEEPEGSADYISLKRSIVFSDRLEEYGYRLALDKELDQVKVLNNQGYEIGRVVEVVKSQTTGNEGYIFETNEISSLYWFTEEGVYRQSDHWGSCRSCEWHLDMDIPKDGKLRTGFINWENFYKIV